MRTLGDANTASEPLSSSRPRPERRSDAGTGQVASARSERADRRGPGDGPDPRGTASHRPSAVPGLAVLSHPRERPERRRRAGLVGQRRDARLLGHAGRRLDRPRRVRLVAGRRQGAGHHQRSRVVLRVVVGQPHRRQPSSTERGASHNFGHRSEHARGALGQRAPAVAAHGQHQRTQAVGWFGQLDTSGACPRRAPGALYVMDWRRSIHSGEAPRPTDAATGRPPAATAQAATRRTPDRHQPPPDAPPRTNASPAPIATLSRRDRPRPPRPDRTPPTRRPHAHAGATRGQHHDTGRRRLGSLIAARARPRPACRAGRRLAGALVDRRPGPRRLDRRLDRLDLGSAGGASPSRSRSPSWSRPTTRCCP